MEFDALTATKQLNDIYQGVKDAFAKAKEEERFRDDEYNDLTHALELINFNGAEGYKLAKELKENRKFRREAKNMQELITPLRDLLLKYHTIFSELKNVQAMIEAIQHTQSVRVYTPRTRTDLQDRFDRALRKEGRA